MTSTTAGLRAAYDAALAARTAARDRGDRAAYLAAAQRCGELARALRAAEEAERDARSAERAAAIDAMVAARAAAEERLRALLAMRRAWADWHAGQEWPACGQGLPNSWVDLVPSAIRSRPDFADLARAVDPARTVEGS